ncbi:hypothetical protein Y032_0693g1588 [Ancylostoma ceylanicum]|uniref:Uncharacterized protein n=1 Tax=Ancylostoma ceylanicum TaxID=53326 RepID=A0A016WIE9_9BILA|nr:hypothetical protein Y032_0693g1588 [Ancylostoma ceylanicum]
MCSLRSVSGRIRANSDGILENNTVPIVEQYKRQYVQMRTNLRHGMEVVPEGTDTSNGCTSGGGSSHRVAELKLLYRINKNLVLVYLL